MNIEIKSNVSDKETKAYVEYLETKYNRKLKSLIIEADGDYVNLNYQFEPVKFERIRRITGYLVGTMDNWNDAKSAEERDRVKHSTSTEMEEL